MFRVRKKCRQSSGTSRLSLGSGQIAFNSHFNKLTSVFHASVLLIDHEFRHSIVMTKFRHSIVMTKFIVNNRTVALKTDNNLFFTITNCQIVRSCSLTRRMNYKFMHVSVRAREFLKLS